MKIEGLVWVGTATERYNETVRFFTEVFELPIFYQSEDLSIMRLPSGDWVEVFGPEHEHHDEFTTGPVVEFLVADLEAAKRELESRGVEFLHETHSWREYSWAHFRGPDGNIWGITSGPYGQ